MKLGYNKHFRQTEAEHYYGAFLPRFAIADIVRSKSSELVSPISSFTTCRETLGAHCRNKVINGNINRRILRILLWFTTPIVSTVIENGKLVAIKDKNKYFEEIADGYDKTIRRSLHALNTIEKKFRWRKSSVRKLEHDLSNRHNFYLFVASPKWMFAPPLLSLFLLIIRSGSFEGVSKAKSIEGLMRIYIKTLQKDVPKQKADVASLKEIAPFLEKFLSNIDKIYKGRKQRANFQTSVLTHGHSAFTEGITALVEETTGDKIILERFLSCVRT